MPQQNRADEISITRLYDAPVKIVWEAWTDPQQVGRWWGPRGFTLTTHSRELKTGGHWHYTMHGPDGVNYVNKTQYLEVAPLSRMVYDHGGNDEQKPLFRVTATFADVNGKTRLDMTMAFPSPEAAATSRVFIKKAGGEATWDRLAEYLAEKTSGKNVFVIHRSFAASAETLFNMWSDPTHFTQWLPPMGFTMQFIRADIREGGEGFYEMTNGKDVTLYGKVRYQTLQRPDRLVYTQEFCDAQEKLARHPHAPTWPATMLTTVTLAAEGPLQTRVQVLWEPIGDVTAEERTTFKNARPGMTDGWTGSFDKLDPLLAQL